MIRTTALLIILLCELLLLALLVLDISASSLSLISTLVIVVVSAFGVSALLRNFQSIKASRNYSISGLLGIVIGVIYFIWAGDNLESMVQWLKETGIYFLLLFIFICAIYLYYSKKPVKDNIETH